MDYGLIGERLGHSYSRRRSTRCWRNDRYELRPIPPEELDAFLRARDFRGLNVTIPYKQAVLHYCAQLSDTARRDRQRQHAGRCARTARCWAITRTSAASRTMLREADIDPAGKKAVVLGSGGTSPDRADGAQAHGCAGDRRGFPPRAGDL